MICLVRKLINIGKYSLPNEVTFVEALKIAKIAVDKYSGKMSNKDVAEAMGYKIKNPASISGYIFRKFDDMCAYNLMKRERGFLSVTAIGYEALDKVDSRKAEEGKAKAIRQIRIVDEAFTKWNGEIPIETAFLSKMSTDFAIPWQEAQKYTESLRKLLIEVFPYLKAVSEYTALGLTETRGENSLTETERKSSFAVAEPHVIGELRTEDYGIIKIKDKTSIAMAKMALDSLERKLAEQEDKTE
jgi:hypothetical protein